MTSVDTFIKNRIDTLQTQILAYEEAIAALTTLGVESYEMDTGQTRERVTKHNLKSLQDTLSSLYNQLAELDARCNGNGTVYTRPGW